MTRLLSIMDPAVPLRRAQAGQGVLRSRGVLLPGDRFHRRGRSRLWRPNCATYLGCAQVETRPICGQMANTTVFSALVDYLNRADRKSEQRRMRCVLNNHIIKGGHLSAQPMGALRDFVARDPRTERPAVVNFPVLEDNPYKIDVAATARVDRRIPPGTDHPRQEHDPAPGTGGRDRAPSSTNWAPLHDHVRHGPRAGAGRSLFPGALRRRGRSRHRVDPQDLLRHPAGDRGADYWTARARASTSGKRSSAGPFPAASATTISAPCSAC